MVGLTGGYKKQIAKRLTHLFVQQILRQFNEGLIGATDAGHHLQISRAHLYRLRTRFLKERSHFTAKLSGGDHWPDWPPEVSAFLKEFLPLQKPPNFQLVADELKTRLGFQRHRGSVDDQGMIKLGDDVRVRFQYQIQHIATNGAVPLTIVRAGKELKVNLPVSADYPRLIPGLDGA